MNIQEISDAFAVGNHDPMFRARLYADNRAKIMNAAGDNTLPAGLQRQVILQESVAAFARVLAPLAAFSTVYNNIPLEGTNVVNIPFYDLEGAASTDFVAATGYVAGETTTATRAITVNKRKYQSLAATSAEWNRQPALRSVELMVLKAQKLAYDVFADVLSVVTAANYGPAVVTKQAALFDSDDVAVIRGACNAANWPEQGRTLMLTTDYDSALCKDAAVKNAFAFNGNVAQTGQIPRIMGFDYRAVASIPANGESLVGFAANRAAICIVFSPIKPNDDVSRQVNYTVAVDAETGIALEYRGWGNAQMDQATRVVECNYGFIKGNGAAIKRITSA